MERAIEDIIRDAEIDVNKKIAKSRDCATIHFVTRKDVKIHEV